MQAPIDPPGQHLEQLRLVWGIFFVIELLVKTMSADVVQYLIAAPLVLFISYLLGGAIHENRQRYRKA